MNHFNRIAGLARCRRGSIATEAAFVLPILVLSIFATVEFTSFVNADLRLRHCAGMLANMVAHQPQVTPALVSDICTGSSMGMIPLPASAFQATVTSIVHAQSGANTTQWRVQGCGQGSGGSNVDVSSQIPLINDSVIVVTATYLYTPILHFFFRLPTYTLTESAFDRPRAGVPLRCPSCQT